jgi:hypothetical protein
MQTSGRTTYQLHESTPLAIAEVPKCQPQLQPTQALSCCVLGGKPPRPDGKIASLGLNRRSCILVLLTQQPVLILEVCSDVGLCMLVGTRILIFFALDPKLVPKPEV